jgi:heterodisulfide reductase subunit C2
MAEEKAFYLTREMLDHTFAAAVAPDREKLLTCIQCGTCTASCPTAYAMDYTPRQLWRLIQVGLREEALSSRSFWLCTSCYSCTVRCPRGISLTETMGALKRLALAEGYNAENRIYRFYKTFLEIIRKRGRLHELEFMALYAGRADPLKLIAQAPMGLVFMRKGKFPLTPSDIVGKNEMETIFRKVEELEARR